MEKKPLRVAYNVVGVLAALTLPTVTLLWFYVFSADLLFLPLFFILPLLAALPIVTLFRKQAHLYTPPLYAAAVGYAFSAKLTELLLPKVSPDAWAKYDASNSVGFSGATWTTGVTEMFFTFPLAYLSLLAAILLTVFYLRKKKKAKNALTANPSTADSEKP